FSNHASYLEFAPLNKELLQIPELRHLYFSQRPEAYCGAVCSLARTELLKQQQGANLAPSGTD
ncbi:MAG: hypothetical protein EBY55_07710, partial [Gammaproteobacteria bacterium]|nr:hypothetical protein [Gammaproteobacteria bacterium]